MMKRMLGFCAGCCCAAAGVLAGPASESDISVAALISAAQDLVCKPLHRLAQGVADTWWSVVEYAVRHGVILLIVMHQRLLA